VSISPLKIYYKHHRQPAGTKFSHRYKTLGGIGNARSPL